MAQIIIHDMHLYHKFFILYDMLLSHYISFLIICVSIKTIKLFTKKLIYRLAPPQALMSATTSTGPAPFPRSSARLKKANAVPRKLIIIQQNSELHPFKCIVINQKIQNDNQFFLIIR